MLTYPCPSVGLVISAAVPGDTKSTLTQLCLQGWGCNIYGCYPWTFENPLPSYVYWVRTGIFVTTVIINVRIPLHNVLELEYKDKYTRAAC